MDRLTTPNEKQENTIDEKYFRTQAWKIANDKIDIKKGLINNVYASRMNFNAIREAAENLNAIVETYNKDLTLLSQAFNALVGRVIELEDQVNNIVDILDSNQKKEG